MHLHHGKQRYVLMLGVDEYFHSNWVMEVSEFDFIIISSRSKYSIGAGPM